MLLVLFVTYVFNLCAQDADFGTLIFNVRATDEDEGSNAEITFSLDDPNQPFDISPSGGAITVAGPLDYETRTEYSVSYCCCSVHVLYCVAGKVFEALYSHTNFLAGCDSH